MYRKSTSVSLPSKKFNNSDMEMLWDESLASLLLHKCLVAAQCPDEEYPVDCAPLGWGCAFSFVFGGALPRLHFCECQVLRSAFCKQAKIACLSATGSLAKDAVLGSL